MGNGAGTQTGTTRIMTTVDEIANAALAQCPNCQVKTVPRGISSTAKGHSAGAAHCPNCGHVFGRNSLLNRKVRHITVTGAGEATTITVEGATLQLSAVILPDYAENQDVVWSVEAGTAAGTTISADGLVTPGSAAAGNGTVTAIATAADGSGVVGSLLLTITNQVTSVTSIAVTGAAGAITIAVDGGTLQLAAAVIPVDAANDDVTWSIEAGTGTASISGSGLVTALTNGTVTAKATADDGSNVVGTLVLTLSNQA